MSELDELIYYWEDYQVENRKRFSPFHDRRVRETIEALKELKKMKGE